MRRTKTNFRSWFTLGLLVVAMVMIPAVIALNLYRDSTRTYTGEVTVTQKDHRPDRSGLWVQGRTDVPKNEPDLYRVQMCPTDPDHERRCWWEEVPRSFYEVVPEGTQIRSQEGIPLLPEGSRP